MDLRLKKRTLLACHVSQQIRLALQQQQSAPLIMANPGGYI